MPLVFMTLPTHCTDVFRDFSPVTLRSLSCAEQMTQKLLVYGQGLAYVPLNSFHRFQTVLTQTLTYLHEGQ
jgi:hypothetical protein